MRYQFILCALLLGFAGGAAAQEATLASPEVIPSPEPVTRLVVAEMHLAPAGGYVTLEFRGATSPRRVRTFAIATGELASFATALDTPVGAPHPVETGGILRRMKYRILAWLADNGRLLDDASQPIAVTLVP